MQGLPLSELRIEGVVARPGDPAYEAALGRVFNKASRIFCVPWLELAAFSCYDVYQMGRSARPDAVVVPSGTKDVALCMRWCRSHSISLSVLGGGRNPATRSLHGQVVLDMSRMCDVHVDLSTVEGTEKSKEASPQRPLVRVGGGATWRQADWEMSLFGLCLPAPILSSIGVAGSTLGGGWGFLTKQHGLSCEAVTSVTVVTADGSAIVASRHQHSELFWALTIGAGAGYLGVVTQLTFAAFPAPAVVYQGLLEFEARAWKVIVSRMRSQKSSWPKLFLCFPGFAFGAGGDMVFQLFVFCAGNREAAHVYLQALLEGASTPLSDTCHEKSYLEAQGNLEELFPARRCYLKARFVPDLSDEIAKLALDHLANAAEKNRVTRIWFQNYFSDTGYLAWVAAYWDDASNDDRMIKWSRVFGDKIQLVLNDDEDMGSAPNFVPAATPLGELFGERDQERIRRVKRQYDPDNYFRFHVFV